MFWVTCTYVRTHWHAWERWHAHRYQKTYYYRGYFDGSIWGQETNTPLADRKAPDHNGDRKPFAIKTVPEALLQLTFVVVMITWDVRTGAGFSSWPNWSATDMLADLPVGSGSSSSCTRLLSGTYIILPVITVNKFKFHENLQKRKEKRKNVSVSKTNTVKLVKGGDRLTD